METNLTKYMYTWRGDVCTIYATDVPSADAIMAKILTKVGPREDVEYGEALNEHVYFQTK